MICAPSPTPLAPMGETVASTVFWCLIGFPAGFLMGLLFGLIVRRLIAPRGHR